MRRLVAGLALTVAAPAAAQEAPVDDAALAGFDLADLRGEEDAGPFRHEAACYLLPEVADRWGEPKALARLRIRGRKVKLRIPIG